MLDFRRCPEGAQYVKPKPLGLGCFAKNYRALKGRNMNDSKREVFMDIYDHSWWLSIPE